MAADRNMHIYIYQYYKFHAIFIFRYHAPVLGFAPSPFILLIPIIVAIPNLISISLNCRLTY